jgi:Fe-S cluster assembly ATP-binding protein
MLITHWKRMLDQVVPDKIHVLKDGKIMKVGGRELALELEEKGYNWA